MCSSPGMDILYYNEPSDLPDYVIPEKASNHQLLKFLLFYGLVAQIKICID